MSEAPERIWAVEGLGGGILSFNDYSQGGTEYTRADLVEAMQAENQRLREALTRIATGNSIYKMQITRAAQIACDALSSSLFFDCGPARAALNGEGET